MKTQDEERLRKVFGRDEICVLGLPFDFVDEEGAVNVLDTAISARAPCFLSTPNLNFAISAMQDTEFRRSVLESDLSVADGMPLIWLSRLIGSPLPERVAGSSLFDRMRWRDSDAPLSVFFFGGMGDVAENACAKLNEGSSGMTAVGYLNPGIGSIQDMSAAEIVDAINDRSPDFLVVSLGAKKGQSWILANRHRLNARVVSHLGAVVNFVAGTVHRAPIFWQKLGLEWVWRILEEPGLWKRYFFDGLKFIAVLVTKAFPLAVYGRYFRNKYAGEGFRYSCTTERDVSILSLIGSATKNNSSGLKHELPNLLTSTSRLVLDLKNLNYADSSVYALLLRISTEAVRLGIRLEMQNVQPRIKRMARLHMLPELT